MTTASPTISNTPLPAAEVLKRGDLPNAQMIEEYEGIVDSQMYDESVMRSMIDLKHLSGTDRYSVRRVSETKLLGIDGRAGSANIGKQTLPQERNWDRAQVDVNTIIQAQDGVGRLNYKQMDVDAFQEYARLQGEALGELFDAAALNVGVNTALSEITSGVADISANSRSKIIGNLGTNMGNAFRSGSKVVLGDADNLTAFEDPNILYAGIKEVITNLKRNRVKTKDLVCFVSPTEYAILTENNKVISRDYSAHGGDYAMGLVHYIEGVKIMETNALAATDIDTSVMKPMSDAALNNQYILEGEGTRCKALVMNPRAIMGAECLAPQSDFEEPLNGDHLYKFYTFMSFGIAPRNPQLAGGVFQFGTDE